MGLLDKFRKEIKTEVSNDGVCSNNYALPFTKVGDEHSGSDFHAICLGPDSYKLYVGPYANLTAKRHTLTGSMGTLGTKLSLPTSLGGREYTVDASTIIQVINGASLPQFGLSRMTKEQKEKLSELRVELENYKKHQRVVEFKKLPPHIRQEIIDECLIKKMLNAVQEIDITKCPDYVEFKKLKDLEDASNQNLYGTLATAGYMTGTTFAGYNQTVYTMSKYGTILDLINHDELMKAHAEASLEDELRD